MNGQIFMLSMISLGLVAAPVWAQQDKLWNSNLESDIHAPAGQEAGQSMTKGEAGEEDAEDMDDQTLQQLLAQSQGVSGTLTAEEASRYTLGATDVISIVVMRHPEVSGEFIINSEGKIQYAFIGDILVSGLTKDEASALISERLSEYIINPDVTVTITGYNSKIVYVVGEVFRPGKIFMRGDTITVREALIEAGLPMLSGKMRKSRLITPSESRRPKRKRVDVYALIFDGDLRENFVMNPGDVLFVPPTFLTSTMRAIQPVTAPLGNASGVGRKVTTGF